MGIKIIISDEMAPFKNAMVDLSVGNSEKVEPEIRHCFTCEHEPIWNYISPLDANKKYGRCGADHRFYETECINAKKNETAYFKDSAITDCPLWMRKCTPES